MKRPLIAILAIIYFAISSGVVMNIHYCMGKPTAVQLDILGAKTCGCGKTEKKGCCKTEFKVFKIEDVQKASYSAYSIVPPVAIVTGEYNLVNASLHYTLVPVAEATHSPPLLSGQDTYLRNCVLRI